MGQAALFGFTVMMGALDGFNPCATGALIFLLGMLIGIADRRRAWLLGLTFILASAIFYFLVMTVWLNTLTFLLDYVVWLRLLIAIMVIVAGLYNIWQFFVARAAACPVSSSTQHTKLMSRIQSALWQERVWPALIGVVMLAMSVNLLEFLCSSGLPVLYAQVLAMQKLMWWQNSAYLLVYIAIFMFDDFMIFFGAMLTWRLTGTSARYASILRIAGGIMMIIFGIVLLVQPTLLSVS